VLLAEGRVAADGPARQVLADAVLLRSASLAVPEAVTLLETLHQAGWDLRTDRLLVDEVVAEIQQAWAKSTRPCTEAMAMEGQR